MFELSSPEPTRYTMKRIKPIFFAKIHLFHTIFLILITNILYYGSFAHGCPQFSTCHTLKYTEAVCLRTLPR